MAIAASHLLTNGSGANQTSYDTASISPTANRLVLVAVANDTTDGVEPTVTGNGMTWVKVATVVSAVGRLTVFRSLSASPSAGALTIDFGAQLQSRCGWSVVEFSGMDTSGANGAGAIVQSATNTGTSATTLAVTLSAFGNAGNATYGAISVGSSPVASITAGTGFTEQGEIQVESVLTVESEFKDSNDTSVDWTSSETAARLAGIAIEIKVAGAATATPRIVNFI